MTLTLDLFSTSQTKSKKFSVKSRGKVREVYDACSNNAPFFAYQIEGKTWGLVQGCCNDWNCPRCGQQRAKEEYGRIVAGAREVGKTNRLYLFTITCRGREMTSEAAQDGYLVWTNRLLTTIRTQAKRANKVWAYASVTERQKREHPHSHFITTYCPDDAVLVKEGENKWFEQAGASVVARHTTLQSLWLERACYRAGLGYMYDLSELDSLEAGSRYVAKYLFKETIFTTVWPKGWRRVRYSQNWPKLPDVKGDAFILLTKWDWFRLSKEALKVVTKTAEAKAYAESNLRGATVFID